MAMTPRRILLLLLTTVLMLGTGAQDKGPVAKEPDTRIDIQVTNIQAARVFMPTGLSTLGIPRPAAAMPWFQIAIEYRIAAGAGTSEAGRWIDDMEIAWGVSLADRRLRRSGERPSHVFLNRTVRYASVDVLQKYPHYAVVYLSPRYLQRLGYDATSLPGRDDLVAFAEIRLRGQAVANSSPKSFRSPKDFREWTKTRELLAADSTDLRKHTETPFIFLDQDLLDEEKAD